MNYEILPHNLNIVDPPEDIHLKPQAAKYSFEEIKNGYLLESEKDDTDPDESGSYFDDHINDIAMVDTNFPDPYLVRLKAFTLELPTRYPLHLGFRQ